MADRGAKYADKRLSTVNRQLRATYKKAQQELQEKLADFNQRYRKKDAEKRRQMNEGKISRQQYQDWLAGQAFMRRQWERKIEQVQQVMLHHNEQAAKIINESRLDVFAENYYSESFKAHWIIRDVGFNVYNTHAIARLLQDNPQILPEWKIDEKKDYKWNYNKVNNIVQQGIIQGESVEQITKRLCIDLSTQNENKMRLFARTAMTGAQSAGRQVQMEQAAANGIQVHKQWLATFDNKTRDAHIDLDGQEVPYNESFESALGEIEFPGDPSADPANVYNCRCTMVTIYPEYEDRSKNWREDETIDGVPYEEWKEAAQERLEKKAMRENGFVQGYTGLVKYDYDKQKTVEIPDEVKRVIDNAGEIITRVFPGLDNYMRLLCFGETDSKDQPAMFSFSTLDKTPGLAIVLREDRWQSLKSIEAFVRKEAESGRHINSTKPEAIIAHEYGHALFSALALKTIGYSGYGQMTLGQTRSFVNNFFLIKSEISDIITQNGSPYLSLRAKEDVSEYAAEAISDYFFGEHKDISVKIVDYFKGRFN